MERLLPAKKEFCFRMDDYWVWDGSLIRVGKDYHLFASRWPKKTGFPDGYRNNSEIVRAIASDPIGPYEFQEIVLSGRKDRYWDGKMCHNPKIVQFNEQYILYYIGSARNSSLRKIGYAFSNSIEGPWTRVSHPLPLGRDANNPSPFIHEDGSVLLAFRDQKMHMYIAKANRFDNHYLVISKNIVPNIKLEDPDLTYFNDHYHLIMEDDGKQLTGDKRNGVHFISSDGMHWIQNNPLRAYGNTISIQVGSFTPERRERPELFNSIAEVKGRGIPTHLITAIFKGNESGINVQPFNDNSN
jgi:hypothetical protein